MNIDKKLYKALDKLVQDPESTFVSSIHEKDKLFYRIFTYHIANYEDFLAPASREARGCMFEVTDKNKFLRLASLAPHKFFNDSENAFTKDLDYSNIDLIMDKLDGSMMNTYMHINKNMQMDVYLKSKGSLSSEQAKAANKLLNTEEYFDFKNFLWEMGTSGHTVNMEFTSNNPEFRIVLRHPKESLTVFSIRRHSDLSYLTYDEIKKAMDDFHVDGHLVPNYVDRYKNDFKGFVASIKDMEEDIEGYVIVIKDGETVKLKTLKYATLHQARGDIVDSPRKLFEIIVNEQHDDLRGVFAFDAYLIQLIDEMEVKVKSIYKEILKNAEGFYQKHKDLSVKDYAILARETVPPLYFGLTMNLKNEKINEYKEFMIKHFRDFKQTRKASAIDPVEFNNSEEKKTIKKNKLSM